MSALMNHVRRSLQRDLELTSSALPIDEDGDICFESGGVDCFATLVGDFARVWAVAARGVKPTVKLLRELNAWNCSTIGARSFVTDGGAVIVCGEVLAASIEPGELGGLVRTIAERAGELGPLLQITYAPPVVASQREVDR